MGVFTVIIIANVRAQVFTIIHKKSWKNYAIFIRPESNQFLKPCTNCTGSANFIGNLLEMGKNWLFFYDQFVTAPKELVWMGKSIANKI